MCIQYDVIKVRKSTVNIFLFVIIKSERFLPLLHTTNVTLICSVEEKWEEKFTKNKIVNKFQQIFRTKQKTYFCYYASCI